MKKMGLIHMKNKREKGDHTFPIPYGMGECQAKRTSGFPHQHVPGKGTMNLELKMAMERMVRRLVGARRVE
jgi:hypothetical protein